MTEIEPVAIKNVHSSAEENEPTLAMPKPRTELLETEYEVEMLERETRAIGDTKDLELMLYYAKGRYGLTREECASLQSALEAAINPKKDYGINTRMMDKESETIGKFFEKSIAEILKLRRLGKGFEPGSHAQIDMSDDDVTEALESLGQ
ncbi:MAG: hypothetical protein AAB408_03055 [Patescibacteria group bacterium]